MPKFTIVQHSVERGVQSPLEGSVPTFNILFIISESGRGVYEDIRNNDDYTILALKIEWKTLLILPDASGRMPMIFIQASGKFGTHNTFQPVFSNRSFKSVGMTTANVLPLPFSLSTRISP